VQLLFSGVYNWEYKSWRPFVAGGAGAYFVRLLRDGQVDPPRETRGGVHFGGGGEYVFDDENAIKVELRWDVVSHPPDLPDATGAVLTVGYKRFF
jgi:phage repressor protein C with HTH and peptisase S24 domain